MEIVSLTGRLICRNPSETDTVRALLPSHIHLTRAEQGCISFEVQPTEDPLVWEVAERFVSPSAFHAHQQRVASSAWGQGTTGIQRDYRIEGL